MQVLKRNKHFIPTHAKKMLYLAYFLPHLTYCSSVWFHCGKRSADIIEKLNESILRFVFNDFKNSYEKLLQEINQSSLRERRINNTLILVLLAFHNAAPSYNNNNFIYTAKTDQLNLNIKIAGILPYVQLIKYYKLVLAVTKILKTKVRFGSNNNRHICICMYIYNEKIEKNYLLHLIIIIIIINLIYVSNKIAVSH